MSAWISRAREEDREAVNLFNGIQKDRDAFWHSLFYTLESSCRDFGNAWRAEKSKNGMIYTVLPEDRHEDAVRVELRPQTIKTISHPIAGDIEVRRWPGSEPIYVQIGQSGSRSFTGAILDNRAVDHEAFAEWLLRPIWFPRLRKN